MKLSDNMFTTDKPSHLFSWLSLSQSSLKAKKINSWRKGSLLNTRYHGPAAWFNC